MWGIENNLSEKEPNGQNNHENEKKRKMKLNKKYSLSLSTKTFIQNLFNANAWKVKLFL